MGDVRARPPALFPAACIALLWAPAATAAVSVRCVPERPSRGERVECVVRAPEPFAIVEWRAEAQGHVVHNALDVRSWAGPAAVDTNVFVTVRSEGGTAPPGMQVRGPASASGVVTASAGFVVAPRSFPRVDLHAEPPPWSYGEDSLFGGWPPLVRGGSSAVDPIAADGSLGVFLITLPTPRTRYVEEGPDARWFYVEEPLAQPELRMRLSRALKPGDPFYAAQRPGSIGLSRWPCDAGEMDLLRQRVVDHETRHFAETRRAFARRDLSREIEAMHLFLDDAMRGDPLHEQVHARLQSFLDQLRRDQRETVDVRAPVLLRCRLRYPQAGPDDR